ncbi:MAG: tRNA (adenosine(37)-N6)-threonylcarbamoyltransferase complex dimerization subunit type 1 TsaB [Candidatus Eisenbacteria bacterium]|nr:tRNA (adenosine(37)-N6)-threonylcarbamoyltransferase complex dimerization subunit type 1 TsaB [Candidatus Eisenbacteria bacterium]
MMRLALETASHWIGVALLDGERVLAEFHEQRPTGQSGALTPAVRLVLERAGVTLAEVRGLAVCEGPGSFTGLRVGAAFGRALADARGIPIVPVPATLALALGAAVEVASPARVVMAAAGDVAFSQALAAASGRVVEVVASTGLEPASMSAAAAGRGLPVPVAAAPLERICYAELVSAPAAAGEVWVCDPVAAGKLVGAAARLVVLEPRAAWVGVYAERAGRAAPAREFLPVYGHRPAFRKRVRPT